MNIKAINLLENRPFSVKMEISALAIKNPRRGEENNIQTVFWVKFMNSGYFFYGPHKLAGKSLTLCQPVSSAHNLCKQIRHRYGLTFVRPDLDPICLTLFWYSWKNFSKKFILKKISRRQKCMKNFPGGKEFCLFVLLLYILSQQLWSWRDSQFT